MDKTPLVEFWKKIKPEFDFNGSDLFVKSCVGQLFSQNGHGY